MTIKNSVAAMNAATANDSAELQAEASRDNAIKHADETAMELLQAVQLLLVSASAQDRQISDDMEKSQQRIAELGSTLQKASAVGTDAETLTAKALKVRFWMILLCKLFVDPARHLK
jgi:hypothetical protein